MAVTSKRKINIERFKSKVKEFWEMTDHGLIKWFLSFQIERDRESRTISINQHAYIKTVVEKFRLTNTRKVATPIDLNVQFSIQQCPSSLNQAACIGRVPYSKAIGSILWATVVSRPDTAYAVGVLSQANPFEGLLRLGLGQSASPPFNLQFFFPLWPGSNIVEH